MINGLFDVSIHRCETRQDVEGLGRRESILVLVALGKAQSGQTEAGSEAIPADVNVWTMILVICTEMHWAPDLSGRSGAAARLIEAPARQPEGAFPQWASRIEKRLCCHRNATSNENGIMDERRVKGPPFLQSCLLEMFPTVFVFPANRGRGETFTSVVGGVVV